MNTDKGVQNMGTRPLTDKQKNKLAIITGYGSFILGWLLCILGFVAEPFGEIADSVLLVLGQVFLYLSSLIGLATYNDVKFREIMNSLNKGNGA